MDGEIDMIDWMEVSSIIIALSLWKLFEAIGHWIYEVIKES